MATRFSIEDMQIIAKQLGGKLGIEKGEINTGVSSLFAIAKALEIPVREFLNFWFQTFGW